MAPCWFEDPDMFMEHFNNQIYIWKLRNKTGATPLYPGDFSFYGSYRNLNALDHRIFVGHSFPWQRSDFEAFIAFLNSKDIFVNCQGLVITTTFPRQIATNHQPNMDAGRIVRFWSHDVLNLGQYGLPVLRVPYREVRYMQVGGPALVELSPRETELSVTLASLALEVSRLQAKISDLESRNENI